MVRPDLATSDAACVRQSNTDRHALRMPLLAVATYRAMYHNDGMPLLEEVAARYASTHPKGSPMRMQFSYDGYDGPYEHTPMSWAASFRTPRWLAVNQRLLDFGLTDPSNSEQQSGSVLYNALWHCYEHPHFIERLLREGFRLSEAEDAPAVAVCMNAPAPRLAVIALRTLLPVYAGRMVFAEPGEIVLWLQMYEPRWQLEPATAFPVVDVLRALGLRLSRAARALMSRVPGLLARVDAADAERVQRTVGVRRLLTRTIGVPEGEIGDAIASWASEGAGHSQRLVVVPPAVRRRHQPQLPPSDA
jgi:hypothetical protein